jgi:hypothetical protein
MKLKLPNFLHTPQFTIGPVRKVLSFLAKYKILILILIFLLAFIIGAIWLRGYLATKVKSPSLNSGSDTYYSNPNYNSSPLPVIPSPSVNNTSNDSDNSGLNDIQNNGPIPTLTPFPTLAPLPVVTPGPAVNPTTTNSGNPNCGTGSGIANSWYSDVYPNPQISTNTGSVALIVTLRDCNENTAPVSDTLSISVSSGDSNTQVNGHSLPYSVTAQNGQANFTVTSQITGTVTLVVQDTTSSFTVTDINDHNPSIIFSGNNSGNSNCSTGSGTPNSWYSDVYPASPISAATGSTVTFTITLRDCNRNTAPVSDTLSFSQTTNDSSFTVNGSALPVSIQTQNGQTTFTVSSQNAGTDNFSIQDTTNSFTITDPNNGNPSINFTPSSTPTPTPIPAPTDTPTPAVTPTPSPTATPSPTVNPSPTNMVTPT